MAMSAYSAGTASRAAKLSGIAVSCKRPLRPYPESCQFGAFRKRCSDRRLKVSAQSADSLKFRRGSQADASSIFQMTLKESMNPLGLKPERFVIAEDEAGHKPSTLGFGQLQSHGDTGSDSFLELRTLIVDPAHRGKGIGTKLVKELLRMAEGNAVWLTTLENSIPFYAPHGFVEQALDQQIPKSLWFEAAAGTVVARIVAKQRLVVLKREMDSRL
ncbi:hypothetical protein WJX73_006222 [Symbiochloris irregularis]|uniref:N-acetyltransferase domain-containing protein n=1 Tax=Symbiochloris irregularis TaxID=706552 RepID=A0AAW1NPS6_9CHLO